MAEDSGAKTEFGIAPTPKVPGKWARLAAEAIKELNLNSLMLDEAASSGLASDSTLRNRSYVSGPQGGEKLTQPKVKREPITVKK